MEYVKTGAGLLMGGVNMVSNFVKTAMPKDQSKIRLRPEVVQIMMDVAYYFFIHTSLPDTKIHVHKLYFDYDLPGPQQAPLRLAASKSREELKNLPALTEIALSILPPSPINYEKMPKLEDLQELNEYKKLFKQLLTLDKVTLIWYTVMRGIIALQHHYKEVNITPPLSLSSPPHEKELHVDSFENKNNLLNSHVNNCFQSTLACIKKALVGKYEFKEVRTCASLVIKGYYDDNVINSIYLQCMKFWEKWTDHGKITTLELEKFISERSTERKNSINKYVSKMQEEVSWQEEVS